ncbi:MAG TPA: NUDIX hydrolase N-terminal domain-containing protein [Gaiellaceae bacterium]|nr:NUDIX hydrolase N-terminal domain-containing protein [Gaiellaceae bacterium]
MGVGPLRAVLRAVRRHVRRRVRLPLAELDGPRLDLARRLQAIAQNGLHYSGSPFEHERYEAVRAIAAELAASELEPLESLVETFAAQTGHACPKIDVRAAAFRDGKVLLVRNVDDARWSLPGGWAETGESPRTSAEKELREESGYTGRATKLVGIWEQDSRDRPRWPFYGWKLAFLCELADEATGELHAIEVDDVGFFGADELPELSVRSSAEQLRICFEHAREPSLPTVFE